MNKKRRTSPVKSPASSSDQPVMSLGKYLGLLWKGGPIYQLEILFQFPRDWLKTRRLRHFLLGIPVTIVGGLLLFLLVIQRPDYQKKILAEYQKQAVAAYEAENYALARLLYARCQAGSGNVDARFGYARSVEKLEGTEAALPLMQELADNVHGLRDPRVHFWLLKYYSEETKTSQAQKLTLIQPHLEQILRLDPKNYEANLLKSGLLLNEGKPAEAARVLEQVVSGHPDVLVRLATIYQSTGEAGRLKTTLERGIVAYRALVEKSPGSLSPLAILSQFLIRDRQYQEALRTLQQEQQHIPKDQQPQFAEIVVRSYLAWYSSLGKGLETLPIRLEIAQQLVGLNPHHPYVLVILAELIQEDEDLEQKLNVSALQEALTRGTAPQMVHFIMGSTAYRKKDYAAAERHWDLAFEKKGTLTPVLLNNLAMIYAERPEPDLAKALEFSNQAVQILPENVEFRDTRGQILSRMKDWKGAILDLQMVVSKQPNRVKALKLLETAYKELGDNDMAGAYHRRIQQLSPDKNKTSDNKQPANLPRPEQTAEPEAEQKAAESVN